MLIEIKVPTLAESVAEATLMSWHKKAGEQVSRGDLLIEIETDKVMLEITALEDGVLSKIFKQDGKLVESDEIIAHLETDISAQPETETSAPAKQPEKQQEETEVKLSPAVRNLIVQYKLDVNDIPTSKGRLSKEDVLAYIEEVNGETVTESASSKPQQARPPTTPAPSTTPATVIETNSSVPSVSDLEVRQDKKVPMTNIRKRIAERLLNVQKENAILTTFNEVNMQAVMDIRARYKDEFEKHHSTRLGFMSFFTKAAVEALKQFPIINASIDGNDIIYHNYFDIGIAVSSERGLVVPIVRDADVLSLAKVEIQIREYGRRAQEGSLSLDDLIGGTFTITNGGVFGSLFSTPIINPPQSAILGMHSIQNRPVAVNNEIKIQPMMYLAVSYDHRIIDGREAVQFLVVIKSQLEEPIRILLQL